MQLADRGEVNGSILDVGCGTGENSLFFAGLGHEVVGVDSSVNAIKKATEKAKQRKIQLASFSVLNVFDLSELNKRFDSSIDCGLFHTFSDEGRKAFVKVLHSVLKMKGKYFMLCFSEQEPEDWGGPRRVTQNEITESFSKGWRINYIREARFETNFQDVTGKAWLSSITRL